LRLPARKICDCNRAYRENFGSRSAPAGAPEGNPYRGLAAFESAHAAAFFGRRIEIRELVDRVRLDPFVVVGGDSGTGKSSLCRAGVLPWLVEHGGWSCVEVVPGRHPVRALAAALAPWTGRDEAALAEQLRDDPDAVARAIRKHAVGRDAAPGKLLVFIDQLEEILTLAARREAQVVAVAIAALAVRSPSLRVLATARSDFLSRLAMLPGLGDEMGRGLYFLRPLGGDRIREAIVRPAAARGVVYESEALVEALVAHVEDASGGLPVLQFTLAELWEARDVAGRTIRAEALVKLGGVAGALARHADRVLAGLRSHERDAARRILLRLVTAQGTRARQLEAELLSDGSERTALEALIRGRVVVASNAQDGAYELAHEALVTGWSTLQGWLTQDAADHAVRDRVAQAAAEWDRIGRGRDLLWGRRQLAEARALDRAGLAPREAGFLAASARALRTRRVAGAVGVAVLVVGAVIAGLAIRARARREFEAMVADQVDAATAAQRAARELATQRDVARDRAFGLFDAGRWSEGEQAWREVGAMESGEELRYRRASEALDSVLVLDPAQAGLRAWAADLTFERLGRAERDRHREIAVELASRLLAYDDGRYRAVLAAEARIELAVAPAGTQVWIERPGTVRLRIDPSQSTLHLPAGSVVLAFEAPGYAATRLPVLLARGETVGVRIAIPRAAAVPPRLIYVPPGRFLFGGSEGSDTARQMFNAAPLHEVTTPGYFIGRYEVTFGEWIEYLDELGPDERRRRIPRLDDVVFAATALALVELGGGRWRLSLKPTTRTYTAETGQRLHYERRTKRADQDWTRFPVSGVSYEDAVAFASWLDRTHRIPGARLCTEYEWERAARGADPRASSDGDAFDPDDANIDITYGRESLAFGPDEVGSHPGSRSPVGADDMVGNVWEWTRSVEHRDEPVLRGGSWYQGVLSARSMNREPGERSLRGILIGLRLCATPP
jgi:formylglycine-generating enzyme required for sulfatase activity